ncbi:MAG: PAS domain S-box protein, partial [Actinomycetota bacterium]|nr:PAS domain S-box protein [Actinomycetota bacterium]
YIGGGFLVFLLLARQILTIFENSRLYHRMEQKNDELVRSEDELRRQKEYSEALALNSPIAIATIDLDSKVVGWNPAAETLFGYARDEAIGRGLDSLVVGTPEMRAEVAEYTQRVSGDEQVSAITRRSRRDGTLVDVELLAVR